ncbi:MAG: deoxycytidine triphosphate deaminase [Bacteroidota bacterium]|nr:deoxycytidine triphosphate deaminase [Bacteroidota bacterium]
MSFLGVKEILKLQEEKRIIDPFLPERVKNGAYELSLGKEVYLTDSTTGKVEVLATDNNRQVDLNPGQFALLLTLEKVNIPKDKIAFISIKAGEKLKGLINVSGFHVDPGFNDHLLFSVYNAGPSTIILNIGEPYFPIWFAEMKHELTASEAYNDNNDHYKKLDHIPAKYIEFLKRGELTSPKALLEKIVAVEQSVNEKIARTNEKNDRNDWLFKIIIGLLIAIVLKVGWDWTARKQGYEEGKKAKELKEEILKDLRKTLTDSITIRKIDTILAKDKDDTNKKEH